MIQRITTFKCRSIDNYVNVQQHYSLRFAMPIRYVWKERDSKGCAMNYYFMRRSTWTTWKVFSGEFTTVATYDT